MSSLSCARLGSFSVVCWVYEMVCGRKNLVNKQVMMSFLNYRGRRLEPAPQVAPGWL